MDAWKPALRFPWLHSDNANANMNAGGESQQCVAAFYLYKAPQFQGSLKAPHVTFGAERTPGCTIPESEGAACQGL